MNGALGVTDALTETLARFRQDLPLYSAAALTIRDKQAQTHNLEFNEAQTIVHKALSEQLHETGRIRAIVLKARQEGVSTYTAARFFRAIHLWPGVVAMVVADSLERAGALYDIYARYYENLPPEIMPVRKSVARQRHLGFTHDSSLSVRPSTDTEAGRAMTIQRLHASELAFWGSGARETWISLMQAVPHTGSEVIVESTARGAGGLFHELWEAAERGESGWLAIFLPWWIHGEYEIEPGEYEQAILQDPEDFERDAMTAGIPYQGENHKIGLRKLAWRRAVITEKFGGDPNRPSRDSVRQFQQEYPATAEEAFLVSGACFFDEDELRRMTRQSVDPLVRGRLRLDTEEDGKRSITIEPNDRAFVRIWERPGPKEHYVIGGDTAEGKLVAAKRAVDTAEIERGGRDYSAAVVLRLAQGDRRAGVVAELHGRIAPEVFAEQLRLLGEYYSCGGPADDSYGNKALVGVERSHSSGQTVLRLLREHYRYNPLYWHREVNRRTRRIGRVIGWVTDSTSRMPMLDLLGEWIRKAQVEIPGRDLIREMVTFVLWEDGKPQALEGCHDDRVIALAVACQMTREHRHTSLGGFPTYTPNEDSQTG